MTHIDFYSENIELPLPPEQTATTEMAVYARFMRHLHHVPCRRAVIKILSSIQFTADIMNYSDAHVAKILVEQGLLAPRAAFPSEYLRFADGALCRQGWDVGAPSSALYGLEQHWQEIGESKFAAFSGEYELYHSEIAY